MCVKHAYKVYLFEMCVKHAYKVYLFEMFGKYRRGEKHEGHTTMVNLSGAPYKNQTNKQTSKQTN